MGNEQPVFASDFLDGFNEVVFVRDKTTLHLGKNDVILGSVALNDDVTKDLVSKIINDLYIERMSVSFDFPKGTVLTTGLNFEGENYLLEVAMPFLNYAGNNNGNAAYYRKGTGTGR